MVNVRYLQRGVKDGQSHQSSGNDAERLSRGLLVASGRDFCSKIADEKQAEESK